MMTCSLGQCLSYVFFFLPYVKPVGLVYWKDE